MLHPSMLLSLAFVFLASCTQQDEKTLRFECEEQSQGGACVKLAEARKGEEALAYLRKACSLGSTKGCQLLDGQGNQEDKAAAAAGLKKACERGVQDACK